MGECLAKCKKAGYDKDDSEQYSWERQVLEDAVTKTDKDIKAAIVSYDGVTLRASVPKGFKPNRRTLKRIIAALKGDASDLTEAGINLMSGTRQFTPAKIDRGKAVYGTDGQGGGCAIFKTKQCLLVVVYKSNPAVATRLASEVAEYMEGHDR